MRILFLTQTPEVGAAARYRVYQYINYLQAEGIDCAISPAMSINATRNLTLRGSFLDRVAAYSQPFIFRSIDLCRIKKYDIIFLQRDILIHFPTLFEWLIWRLNKNLIFDFDDALYTHPEGSRYPLFYRFKIKNKIPSIIKMSKYIIAGNQHLREYALRYNRNVECIPTSIDTDRYRIQKQDDNYNLPVIGWIGRPGSSLYLGNSKAYFRDWPKKHKFILYLVGSGRMAIEGVRVINKEWKQEEEVRDIFKFDIGIMPLSRNEWTQGKSATKALQCMAAGVPVVCSAVGANCDIIKEGENGFLASSEDEWLDKLSELIENKELREKIGQSGRLCVEEKYSVKINAPKVKAVLEKVYKGL